MKNCDICMCRVFYPRQFLFFIQGKLGVCAPTNTRDLIFSTLQLKLHGIDKTMYFLRVGGQPPPPPPPLGSVFDVIITDTTQPVHLRK